jgi:hypothetical protein
MANEEPKPCMVLEGEVVPIELAAAGQRLIEAEKWLVANHPTFKNGTIVI